MTKNSSEKIHACMYVCVYVCVHISSNKFICIQDEIEWAIF